MSTELSILSSSPVVSMTSREIAELTGKRHDNVLRDIDNLLKTLDSDLRTGISEAYDGDPANGYRYFILDRDSTYCLVAGYDANARMKIIKRWQELESQPVTPSLPPFRTAVQCVPDAVAAARAFGFEGSQAALFANRVVARYTGYDLLEAGGASALLASTQESLLIPTELASELHIKLREVNPLLVACGLQTDRRDHHNRLVYDLTEAGKTYGVYVDVDKRSGGAPVRQIKWRKAVLTVLTARLQVEAESA